MEVSCQSIASRRFLGRLQAKHDAAALQGPYTPPCLQKEAGMMVRISSCASDGCNTKDYVCLRCRSGSSKLRKGKDEEHYLVRQYNLISPALYSAPDASKIPLCLKMNVVVSGTPAQTVDQNAPMKPSFRMHDLLSQRVLHSSGYYLH